MSPVATPEHVSQRTDGVLGHVSDLMSSPVLTVDIGETLWDAWQLMFVSGLHHLVVVKDGMCVGVLTDRTLLADLPLTAEHLGRRRVLEVIAQLSVPMVRADDPATRAAVIMTTHGVEAVAVVDPVGRIVGLVTLSDVVSSVSHAAHHADPLQ